MQQFTRWRPQPSVIDIMSLVMRAALLLSSSFGTVNLVFDEKGLLIDDGCRDQEGIAI